MGYYVRVLTTSPDCVPFSDLEAALKREKLKAGLSIEAGTAEDWTQLILKHKDGREITAIERNVVASGSLGSKELEEFGEEVAGQIIRGNPPTFCGSYTLD